MTGRYVDLSRPEVVVTAKLFEKGDQDGFGIVDDRGFWSSTLYRAHETAVKALALAESELVNPVVVPVILQGQARHRIDRDGYLILSPDNYRTSMSRAEFERRFMPEAEWEVRKATAHEWMPPEWRRNSIVPPQESNDAA